MVRAEHGHTCGQVLAEGLAGVSAVGAFAAYEVDAAVVLPRRAIRASRDVPRERWNVLVACLG